MSDWIEWNSGECPVDNGELVCVKFRNLDSKVEGPVNGAELRWIRLGSDGDIVAYKIIDSDPVNNPSHYQLLPGVEVIDVRDAIFSKMPTDTPHDIADCWSRSWEYLTRMWGKNGIEDAKKARFYLDRMIKKMEGEQ